MTHRKLEDLKLLRSVSAGYILSLRRGFEAEHDRRQAAFAEQVVKAQREAQDRFTGRLSMKTEH